MLNVYDIDDCVYTIKKGTQLRDIPMLAGIGEVAQKGGCYSGFNIGNDGSVMLTNLMPCVYRDEINDFEYRTLKFYSYPLTGGISALLVRGAFSMDIVLDGSIYPDDRIEQMTCPGNSIVLMFQSDTMNGKITAIRSVVFPEELMLKLQQMIQNNMKMGYLSRDTQLMFYKQIASMPPKHLEDNATLIGTAIDEMIPKSIDVAPYGLIVLNKK